MSQEQHVAAALRQIAGGVLALADAIENPVVVERLAEREAEGQRLHVSREAIRDWIVAQRDEPFTSDSLMARFDITKQTANRYLRWAAGRGMIEQVGDVKTKGRPLRLWAYVKPKAEGGSTRSKAAKKAANGSKFAGSAAPTGRQLKIPNKEVRKLVGKLRRAGYQVVESGSQHYRVIDREGKSVGTLPRTPSDHRALVNARSTLRQQGVPV